MASDNNVQADSYPESMTKEQAEAYNSFIDYMAELYGKYGCLFEENEGEEPV